MYRTQRVHLKLTKLIPFSVLVVPVHCEKESVLTSKSLGLHVEFQNKEERAYISEQVSANTESFKQSWIAVVEDTTK